MTADDAKRIERRLTAAQAELASMKRSLDRCDDARIAAERRAQENERDARRYHSIRESGIPCLQGDDCGSCTGDELDKQIDDAIAHPEKYDV